jgi:hypothetical protein
MEALFAQSVCKSVYEQLRGRAISARRHDSHAVNEKEGVEIEVSQIEKQ